MQDELLNSYMQVLNESSDLTKGSEVKGATKPSNKPFGDSDAEEGEANSADEFVKLEKPKSVKTPSEKDGRPKKVSESKRLANPFESLYNKILKENSFEETDEDDDATDLEFSDGDISASGEGEDFEGDDDFSLEDEEESDMDDLGDELDDEEGEIVDVKEIVGQLQDILAKLESIVDDEEEEVEDIEDIEDEEDDLDLESDDDLEGLEGEDDLDSDLEEDEEDDSKTVKESCKKGKLCGSKNKRPAKAKKKSKLEEAFSIKGLSKNAKLKSFKGNIKGLQTKKAEVKKNSAKPSGGKPQISVGGKGKFDGTPSKLSPNAGHNLMKPSSHVVSGLKTGKTLFEQ